MVQMWKGLSVITDSPSPIVVVLSGSMEPAFQRGDLLFLTNRNILQETDVGEIVVYNVKDKDIPIVHRIVRKFGSGCVFTVRAGAIPRRSADGSQGGRQVPYERRQQRRGRHRTFPTRKDLFGPDRYDWVRALLSCTPAPRPLSRLSSIIEGGY
jgi:hypothetical protein